MNGILNMIVGGFSNPKTTLAALIGAAAILLKQFGIVDISSVDQSTIVAFTLLVLGWISGDAKSTNLVGEDTN